VRRGATASLPGHSVASPGSNTADAPVIGSRGSATLSVAEASMDVRGRYGPDCKTGGHGVPRPILSLWPPALMPSPSGLAGLVE
jgi:hypothetical protein